VCGTGLQPFPGKNVKLKGKHGQPQTTQKPSQNWSTKPRATAFSKPFTNCCCKCLVFDYIPSFGKWYESYECLKKTNSITNQYLKATIYSYPKYSHPSVLVPSFHHVVPTMERLGRPSVFLQPWQLLQCRSPWQFRSRSLSPPPNPATGEKGEKLRGNKTLNQKHLKTTSVWYIRTKVNTVFLVYLRY